MQPLTLRVEVQATSTAIVQALLSSDVEHRKMVTGDIETLT